MSGYWILLFLFVCLTYFIPRYDRDTRNSQALNGSTKSSSLSIINFSKIIHLSYSILQRSERYSKDIETFRTITVLSLPSDNETLIENSQLEKLLHKLNETTRAFKCKKTKQLRSHLFYLKTHKTGSSTLNGIIWRSLCFANKSSNCFLPSLTNPGKTFDERDIEQIISFKGTNHSHEVFDVWNSHIRIAYFEALLSQGNVKDVFSRRFFDEIVPNPRYFLSILRRPAYRFESAFHWYELMNIYRSQLNTFARSKEELSYVSFKSQLSSKLATNSNKYKKRVKNRINIDKLNNNSSIPSFTLLIEFIEDIAHDILQSIKRKIDTRCNHPDHHCQNLFSKGLFAEISKEAIDDVLSSFEMIFHHRSGFQTLSKELLGMNQFQFKDDQTTFEKNFSLLLQLLFSSSSPSSWAKLPCLSQIILLNIEEMETSVLLLKSILNLKSILPFLYLTQKQQFYVKLSGQSSKSFGLYYDFLDLLQYYDLLLYTVQTSLLSTLSEAYHVTEQEKDELRNGLLLLRKVCSTTHSPMKFNFKDIEMITEKWNKWILSDVKSITHFINSIITSSDLRLFCQLYQMDNYDYVQYFHYRNQQQSFFH